MMNTFVRHVCMNVVTMCICVYYVFCIYYVIFKNVFSNTGCVYTHHSISFFLLFISLFFSCVFFFNTLLRLSAHHHLSQILSFCKYEWRNDSVAVVLVYDVGILNDDHDDDDNNDW